MVEIKIPPAVEQVLNVLYEHGEEAYIVGGCVRDSIMGKQPKDWDITTSATPLQIKTFFPKTVDTGIKHGTVTVLHCKEAIEVTTFRVDGAYEKHRRPKEVSFTKSLKEDVARRDFTVNAMAYAPQTGLIDYFEGQKDIKKALIRCVGNPKERFEEDALRMMRAIRFAAALDFQMEAETSEAIKNKKNLIQAVSQERIRVEFVKTLYSEHPECLEYFSEYGLLPYFLPEIVLPLKQSDVFYQELKKLPLQGYSRLAYFFGNIGHGEEAARQVKRILKRLTFDNHTIALVTTAIKYGDLQWRKEAYFFRKLLSTVGLEVTQILLEIGDAKARFCPEEMLELMEEAKTKPLSIADLDINGRDIIGLGITDGKRIGSYLEMLLESVLQNPERNSKEQLIQMIQDSLGK